MNKLSCKGCTSYAEYSGSLNLGQINKETSYMPVMTHGMENVYWLCLPCYVRVHDLAMTIMDKIGDDQLYFPSLLKPL